MVLTVAEFSKQKVEFVSQTTPKDKEFLAKAPLGKCPILNTANGVLTNSHSIVRFLALNAKALYGENSFEKGQIDSWIDFSAEELEPVF